MSILFPNLFRIFIEERSETLKKAKAILSNIKNKLPREDVSKSEVTKSIVGVVKKWGAVKYHVDETTAEIEVKKMIHDKNSSDLFREVVEIGAVIEKKAPDDILVKVCILLAGGNDALVLPIERHFPWHDLPWNIRNDFIQGAGKALNYKLYTKSSGG